MTTTGSVRALPSIALLTVVFLLFGCAYGFSEAKRDGACAQFEDCVTCSAQPHCVYSLAKKRCGSLHPKHGRWPTLRAFPSRGCGGHLPAAPSRMPGHLSVSGAAWPTVLGSTAGYSAVRTALRTDLAAHLPRNATVAVTSIRDVDGKSASVDFVVETTQVESAAETLRLLKQRRATGRRTLPLTHSVYDLFATGKTTLSSRRLRLADVPQEDDNSNDNNDDDDVKCNKGCVIGIIVGVTIGALLIVLCIVCICCKVIC